MQFCCKIISSFLGERFIYPISCIIIMKTKKPKNHDVWDEIEERMKDPDFVRAAYEFIRLTT